MDEMLKTIEKMIEEEMKDHESYLQLAQHAYEIGLEEYSPILEDIAEEERIHSCHLADIFEELKTHKNHA